MWLFLVEFHDASQYHAGSPSVEHQAQAIEELELSCSKKSTSSTLPQESNYPFMMSNGEIIVKKPSLQGLKSVPNPTGIPILLLDSLDGSFTPKRIDLYSRIKIGRKVKQGPVASNGVFDSKVLSRAHAEIYYDSGAVLVMDVKSSNGTFVNGSRLRWALEVL
jgi:hypothetical protein